jgi:hypothetical protein
MVVMLQQMRRLTCHRPSHTTPQARAPNPWPTLPLNPPHPRLMLGSNYSHLRPTKQRPVVVG